ncbi:MAG TPA: hypothetical protein VF772_01845 [Terriglobales bacterium]
MKQTIAAKPKLVQISTAYGAPKDDDAVIPRSKYVEIRQEKPQRKEQRDWPEYKTCKFTAEAMRKAKCAKCATTPTALFTSFTGE